MKMGGLKFSTHYVRIIQEHLEQFPTALRRPLFIYYSIGAKPRHKVRLGQK